MTHTLVRNAVATLSALLLSALPRRGATRRPGRLYQFRRCLSQTPFRGRSSSSVFRPDSADLGGNAFGGRIGVGSLYHSGSRSWMVEANGVGVITFETDGDVVEFYARVLSSATGETVITAFDAFDVIVDGPVAVEPGAGWQLVSLTGGITRIDVANLDGAQLNGIDDFGFTPLPEPGTALTLASGVALLIVIRHRRYGR